MRFGVKSAATVIAASTILAAGPAAAEGFFDDVYVGVKGGVSFFDDTDFDIGGGGTNVENEYENGFTASVVVGKEYDLTNSPVDLRAEIELNYSAADIDTHTVGGTGVSSSDSFGDTTTFAGFVNGYVDYEVAPRVDLFAGGGVGYGNVDFDGHGVTGPGVVMDDDAGAFAYHLDAGVAYDVTENVTLEASYRYQSFVGAELTATDGTDSDIDLDSHNLLVGLRYKF